MRKIIYNIHPKRLLDITAMILIIHSFYKRHNRNIDAKQRGGTENGLKSPFA
jgi:hypothetical protein